MKITRQQQKELTRKKIIAQALQMFATQGISATNTANIAKAVGVSHGAVFLHFATRDDLVLAVMEEFGERLAAAFRTAMAKATQLRKFLKAHLQVLAEYEDFYRHLITEIEFLPTKVKSLLFIIHASVSHRMFLIAEQQMQKGKIRKLNRALLFNSWIALLHYYLINKAIFSPTTSVIQEKGEELLNHFMQLVKY